MNTTTQQAEFCRMLAERLAESVAIREESIQSKGYGWVGYGFQASIGAGKYQIKADIIRLRRELQRLREMIEGVETA